MRKIIEGKRYDTEKAERIGEWSQGYRSDFKYAHERLYVTKKGCYFIWGQGGAMSGWAETCEDGRSWTGGEGIRPLTREEAFEWAQAHLEPEEFEGDFPDLIEEA